MFDPLNSYKTKKKRKKFSLHKKSFPFLFSIVVHSIIIFVLFKQMKQTITDETKSKNNKISVRFNNKSTAKQTQTAKNTTNIIEQKKPKIKTVEKIKKNKTLMSNHQEGKKFTFQDKNQGGAPKIPPVAQQPPPQKWEPHFPKELQHLLPNSRPNWAIEGGQPRKKEPWGPQTDSGESDNPIGPLVAPRPKIVHKSYDYAGYFTGIDRLFSNAWGGTRFLPRNSRFRGISGEVIEYQIVINRDGSLRRITNITAKKDRFRDFSDVDELVSNVFKNVFPIQPVPNRIPDDPLVMTKRIVFEGYYQFEMF